MSRTDFLADFDRLVTEAETQSFSGWDFSYLTGRWHEEEPPWDYRQRVQERIKSAAALLDMGTGGGEFLAGLAPLPPQTWATEAYPPNVPIAASRLAPLGVHVVAFESDDALPLESETFDLVINRHEAFSVSEVFRILRPGGSFLTQQVGGRNNIRLNELLETDTRHPYAHWTLEYAVRQLEAGGFEIVDQREAFPETQFFDIGALTYYLKIITWELPDFSIQKYRDRLIAIHHSIQSDGPLISASHRFLIEARKP